MDSLKQAEAAKLAAAEEALAEAARDTKVVEGGDVYNRGK